MPKYIDIHAHVNFNAFKEDGKEVTQRALDNDVWFFNTGSQLSTSKRAVNFIQDGVYAIIGLHPIHTGKSYQDEEELGFTSSEEEFNKEEYLKLAQNKKVVAIGECGLDYFRCTSESIEKQKEAFISQIKLANEVNKPLMLHIRNNPKNELNAYQDVLELLKKYSKVKGDVHFFAGSMKDAKDFLDFGFTLSFTGVITFTKNYDEIIKMVPNKMIMAETDSPYVAPVPHRGKRNEPLYVKEVVKRIAEIKGISEEKMAEIIVQNAKRVFDI
ncbi:MAG: TatD family hydrolase [Patescibacteria group bacterium]|nr:TatD family hydrolase [Patescibacteria group bacterium]